MTPVVRQTDLTSHATPLSPGPGSPTVNIGDLAAWRAAPAGVGGGIEVASNAVKQLMDQPLLDPVALPAELAKINASLGQSAAAAASMGSPGASAEVGAKFTELSATATAETATYTSAAAVPGGEPAARATFTLNMKNAIAGFAGAAISAIAAMTDIHACTAPGIPPHGAGVVTKGSRTVLINDLPATRQGDQLFEAAGGADPIAGGCSTVLIGDAGG